MKKNLLFQLLLAAFLLPVFSCSDDDSMPEINNADHFEHARCGEWSDPPG